MRFPSTKAWRNPEQEQSLSAGGIEGPNRWKEMQGEPGGVGPHDEKMFLKDETNSLDVCAE